MQIVAIVIYHINKSYIISKCIEHPPEGALSSDWSLMVVWGGNIFSLGQKILTELEKRMFIDSHYKYHLM